MKKNKRKPIELFISEPPQKYFLILQLGILLTTLVFLLSIIMYTVTSLMEPSQALVASGQKLNALFDQMIYDLFVKVSILFVIAFFINALLGLFFLERLTGPLLRIQKALEDMASGRLPDSDIHVRDSDYPKDLAHALSALAAQMRRKKAGM